MTSLISRTASNPIGRNVLFLGISGAAKGVSSVAFILLAVRTLEPGEAGEVILAFLFVRIFQNVAGAGYSRYLAREAAHDPDAADALTLGVIKLLALGIPLGLLAGAVTALVDARIGLAIVILSLAAVPGSIQQAVGGTFLGRDRTYLDSATETLAACALVAGAVFVSLLDRGPLAYMAVVAASRMLACVLALGLFGWVFRPAVGLLKSSALNAFNQGVPYMLNAGSSFVFLRADILMLGVLSGTRAVSIYGGVADPLVTLGATVHIVNTAFLPGLSRSDADRPRLAGKMLGLDLVLGCSLALLVLIAAGPFTERALGGDHQQSIDVLRVLSVALALRFVNNGLATWLTASGHQWRRTAIAIAAGVFNVCANLVAIPIWGYWAAVWTTLATETIILGISFVALQGEWSPKALPRLRPPAAAEGYPLGRD